ncbi:flap endonuclease-1 [Candidatus Lokiarchaeum ossiferum]|uniref:flap endonuclease-1 n=1 Tax=Candidatus Lokiarchaeum ossiferum TaxID=2951803 RepID=UPI00352D4E6A
MGVKITPLVQEEKKIITFENLVGKKIAIDAFNTLYQFLAIIRGVDGSPLKDYSGEVTSHLSGLFYRTINIVEKDIQPIFVFDGLPNPLKMEEIERRRTIRKDATKRMHEAQDLGREEEAAKFAQASSKLTSEMIAESKDFIKAMGIPIIQAKQDGEAQAAYLVKQNYAWAVGSQDYDALLFGAPRVVRNLSQNRTKKVKSTTVKVDLEWLSLAKILQSNELTQEQLVDIGILTGVDFFPGIEGVGAKTAYKLIKSHHSIDSLMNNNIEIRKKPISESLNMDMVNQVRNIFLKPEIDPNIPPLKWKKPNQDKIFEILCEKHNFNKERVSTALNRLKKKAGSTQRTLGDFF